MGVGEERMGEGHGVSATLSATLSRALMLSRALCLALEGALRRRSRCGLCGS